MSTKLIPVISGTIQDQPAQLVNARDLHAFLGVGRDFSNWIKGRISEYGFVENQDFVLIRQNGRIKEKGGDRRSIEYHLTLDTAKELSMVERTEKGREARRYFIECERRLIEATQAPALAPPSVPHLPRPHFLQPILAAWHARHGDRRLTVREALADLPNAPDLSQALRPACVDHTGHINPWRMGALLRSHQGYAIGGYRIERAGTSHQAKYWRIVRTASESANPPVSPEIGENTGPVAPLPAPASFHMEPSAALPEPTERCELPPDIYRAAVRKARAITDAGFDKVLDRLQARLEELAVHYGPDKCLEWLDAIGTRDGEFVILPAHELWKLTTAAILAYDATETALNAVHRLETLTGRTWYGRGKLAA